MGPSFIRWSENTFITMIEWYLMQSFLLTSPLKTHQSCWRFAILLPETKQKNPEHHQALASNSRPVPPRRNRLAHSHGHLTMPTFLGRKVDPRETDQSKSYENQPDNHWNENQHIEKNLNRKCWNSWNVNLPYLFTSSFFTVKTMVPTKTSPILQVGDAVIPSQRSHLEKASPLHSAASSTLQEAAICIASVGVAPFQLEMNGSTELYTILKSRKLVESVKIRLKYLW